MARAGSWSAWMGVFDRGWMELLQAGGMSYARARRLTKRLCRVIRESRSEIARARNERQQQERQRGREAKEKELNEAVTALHARDGEATVTLERLRASGGVGGLGGVRHRAAVAEVRRHLGGGGKRGWAE